MVDVEVDGSFKFHNQWKTGSTLTSLQTGAPISTTSQAKSHKHFESDMNGTNLRHDQVRFLENKNPVGSTRSQGR
jgi:hypothetical protein